MKMTPHIRMGRFFGGFYELPDGKAVYLAHRKRTEVFRAKNAWCIDLKTLEECRERGINYIGVITKSGKDVFYYITSLNENYQHPPMPDGVTSLKVLR